MSRTISDFLPLSYLCHTPCHLQHLVDDPLLLLSFTRFNTLDLFKNSFLGMIVTIWATIPEKEVLLRGDLRLFQRPEALLLTVQ